MEYLLTMKEKGSPCERLAATLMLDMDARSSFHLDGADNESIKKWHEEWTGMIRAWWEDGR